MQRAGLINELNGDDYYKMKITKKQLKNIIRENMAMRMTQDRMRKSGGGSFSEPRATGPAQR